MSKVKIDLSEGSNASIQTRAGVLNTYVELLNKTVLFKGHTTVLGNIIDESLINALRSRIDQLKNSYSIKYYKSGERTQVPLSEKMNTNKGFYRTDPDNNDKLVYVSDYQLRTNLKWYDHPDNHHYTPRKK